MVLPLVPVIPATVRLAEGASKKRSAMNPSCALKFGTAHTTIAASSGGGVTPGAGSQRIARAPAATACCAKSRP